MSNPISHGELSENQETKASLRVTKLMDRAQHFSEFLLFYPFLFQLFFL